MSNRIPVIIQTMNHSKPHIGTYCDNEWFINGAKYDSHEVVEWWPLPLPQTGNSPDHEPQHELVTSEEIEAAITTLKNQRKARYL